MNDVISNINKIAEIVQKDMKKKVSDWRKKHIEGIFMFNILIVILLLLRSANYFHPFVILTVNKVVIISLILSVVFLGARNKAMFVFACIFWIFAAFFKIVNIDIWAERMGIYTFEAFLIGLMLLIAESLAQKKQSK